MSGLTNVAGSFTSNEMHLIAEAVRRAGAARLNAGVDPAAITLAILAEANRGTRNMFALVKAGQIGRASTR